VNHIELEIVLNSLDAASREIIKQLYYHYSDTRETLWGIPLCESPVQINELIPPDWLTSETNVVLVDKLVANNLVIRGIYGKTSGADNVVRFNTSCLDDGSDMLDIIKKWLATPTLQVLLEREKRAVKQVKRAQKDISERLASFIHGARVTEIKIDPEDTTMCTIILDHTKSMSDERHIPFLRLPVAVVNSADPMAAFNAINARPTERKTKMQP
jgi:hypothetical protein